MCPHVNRVSGKIPPTAPLVAGLIAFSASESKSRAIPQSWWVMHKSAISRVHHDLSAASLGFSARCCSDAPRSDDKGLDKWLHACWPTVCGAKFSFLWFFIFKQIRIIGFFKKVTHFKPLCRFVWIHPQQKQQKAEGFQTPSCPAETAKWLSFKASFLLGFLLRHQQCEISTARVFLGALK